jgi:recombination protein RecR
MLNTSDTIEKAIEYFSSLPSIGRKTAHRLVYHILKQHPDYTTGFADAIRQLSNSVGICSVCFTYTDTDPCPICSSEKRDRSIICVVEDPKVIASVEKTNEFKGLYHVLHGLLNPLDGITPDDIRVRELIARVDGVKEIILTISPSIEGETTMQYIAKMLKSFDIKVTRLASGLPIGSSLEYSDEATLCRALENRINV